MEAKIKMKDQRPKRESMSIEELPISNMWDMTAHSVAA